MLAYEIITMRCFPDNAGYRVCDPVFFRINETKTFILNAMLIFMIVRLVR
jgi:hypothetical protein